ncbi:AAA family ATPase (plasmid) [Streptomonospora nanhaiensis]|uniref:DNA 5'-3' helicase n=1 Tax=Streptomonospora nanhaiensis TaxID=1323731 RepID=A0ABY6YWP4_9ACTN|nr:DnaB-like helicase C-terminal domain-containing protein [Streptomonospora nanhaiensis]WAE76827.1 AAA family ATPase [Streptomonospora nanhaiensis]
MTATLDPHHAAPAPEDERVPHNTAAEQSVLGGVLTGGSDTVVQVQELVSALDFYRPAHQVIFEAVCALADRGDPHDATAVHAELVKRGDAVRVGGALYLHTLTEAIPTAANAGFYAKIVADQARLRRIMTAGIHAAQMARTAEGDLEDIATRATEEMERAAFPQTRDADDTAAIGEDAEYWDYLSTPHDPAELVVPPYTELAEIMPSLTPGELTTIAGRTGVGKSVCATDFARHAAIVQGHTVLYVSLEMDRMMMLNRIYAAEGRIPYSAFKKKAFTDRQWEDLTAARQRVAGAPLHISTPSACTVAKIRARIRSLERRGALPKLVIVDHIGRMTSSARVETRAQEVSRFTWGLKEIARDHHIAVVAVCQINRGPEHRADPVPTSADLKDSGSIEEDSGSVLIVHRPDRGQPEHERAGEVDLVVAKNREGPAGGTVLLSHQLHYQRFRDMPTG